MLRTCPRHHPHRWPTALPLLIGTLVLAGCSSTYLQSQDSLLGVVTPYRMEVVQGNVVTQEQAALVRPGASRAQVREALGSPLVTDLFHAERWDYVFTIRRQGTEPQRRVVTALFEGDALKKLETPQDLPTEREFVAAISRQAKSNSVPVLELTEAQRAALPRPVATAASAPAALLGVTRSYPPLEPTP
ncbi:small protein A (tmRNA-binding) [Burkholderiales bacterium JOSHI_001]|nr:small protein A (tmRNA-binding) [Burkholderiales bacterium JOSHI_001]